MHGKEDALTEAVRGSNREAVHDGYVLAPKRIATQSRETGNANRPLLGNTRRNKAARVEAGAKAKESQKTLITESERADYLRRLTLKPRGACSSVIYLDGRQLCVISQRSLPSLEKLWPFIVSREDSDKRDKYYAALKADHRRRYKPEISERQFRDRIVSQLQDEGWQVKIEVKTTHGFIDIKAEKLGETRIIEVKVCSDSNAVSHALGQLLFYKADHPQASLFVATPIPLSAQTRKVLKRYQVGFYEA